MEVNKRPKTVRVGAKLLYAALWVAGLRSVVEAATNARLLGAVFMILMLGGPDIFDLRTVTIYDYKFVRNPGRGIPAAQQARNRANVPCIRNQIEINP